MDAEVALTILDIDIKTLKKEIKIYEYQFYTWRSSMKSCASIEDDTVDYLLKEIKINFKELDNMISEAFEKKHDITDEDLNVITRKYYDILAIYIQNFNDRIESTYIAFRKECQIEKTTIEDSD